jgi:hypothetical protein
VLNARPNGVVKGANERKRKRENLKRLRDGGVCLLVKKQLWKGMRKWQSAPDSDFRRIKPSTPFDRHNLLLFQLILTATTHGIK